MRHTGIIYKVVRLLILIVIPPREKRIVLLAHAELCALYPATRRNELYPIVTSSQLTEGKWSNYARSLITVRKPGTSNSQSTDHKRRRDFSRYHLRLICAGARTERQKEFELCSTAIRAKTIFLMAYRVTPLFIIDNNDYICNYCWHTLGSKEKTSFTYVHHKYFLDFALPSLSIARNME